MTSIQIDIKDGLSSSVAIKGPCKVATTANITLIGEQTIDGVAVVTDDRVLVKDQTTASDNGIYVVDTGNWRRSKDFNKTKDVKTGTLVNVYSGAVGAGIWELTTADPISVGSTNLVFSQSILTSLDILDEDDMASNSATKVPSQQSVKAYVDTNDALHLLKSANLSDVANTALARNALQTPVYVATVAALQGVDSAADKVVQVYNDGFKNGVFDWVSTDQSANVTIDTKKGVYVPRTTDPTGATGCWKRRYYGFADVRWFGAALDDATDDKDAFNVALAVANSVYFPAGRAYVTDMVTVPNNKQLVGVNVSSSIFSVKATFNMAALGVVKMGSSENTGLIDKIGFEFVQATDGIRANLTQYPPAIYHNAIPRVRIGHIRISRAWNGIDAGGNSGGSTYDWVECGALNVGLTIDGALDTMNIGRFRFWPFGMTSGWGSLYTGAYSDGTTKAVSIGRCDGLEGEIHSFKGFVDFPATGVSSAGRHLHALHLDGDGARLRVLDGPLDIGYLYCTKTSAVSANSILLDGAGSPEVRIADIDIRTSETGQAILVNIGSLSINGGRIDHRALGVEAALVQAGTLKIRNTELTALGVRTVPYVQANNAAATLIVQDCDGPNNAGTGILIKLLACTQASYVSNNIYNGRSLSVATNMALGKVKESLRGYCDGAATTTQIPTTWTIVKSATGQYDITHNLGWSLIRTHIVGQAPAAGDTTVVWDKAGSTINMARIRTAIAGVLTDREFTVEIAHI